MKKLISAILVVIMLLSVIPFTASAEGFDDVSEGKWYTEGINFCVANGFMAGVADGQFDRNGTLTRAMFVTILAQVDWADTEPYANEQVFTDVAPGKWYSGAVNWAYANGLASGLGDGTFGYKNPVTREQMAVFLYAYMCYAVESGLAIDLDFIDEADIYIDLVSRADLSLFDDADRIHSWASDAMSWAVAAGLFTGTTETTLDPRGNCTRAQAAVLIYALHRDVINGWCEHEWIEATCTTPGYCTNCDLTGGFKDHAYDDEGLCTVCGTLYDAEDDCGHVWIAASCSYAKFCWRCFKEVGEPLEHNLVPDENGEFYYCTNEDYEYKCEYTICAGEHTVIPADCYAHEFCVKCYAYLSDPLGHEIGSDGICIRCGGEYDAENDCVHYWIEPGCVTYGYCVNCGMRNAAANGHDYDAAGYCRECGYSDMNDHQHFWNLPLCFDGDNYCLICGEIPERVDHEYDEHNHCIYCGSIPPCEEHTWLPATCRDHGYCAVCYTINPDEPSGLGHDHDEETKLCVRCNLYRDWSLNNYEHIKKNIRINGLSLPDGSLSITEKYSDGTVYIFMRPQNDEDFFVQFIPNEEDENFWRGYSGMVELTFDETPEVNFSLEVKYEGEFIFSANGDFDRSRDENFDGIDYTNCLTIKDVWNEAELPDEEVFEIVCRFISLTMVNAGTTASQRLDTNLDPNW